MKQVVEVVEIKKKIEKLIKSANKGFNNLYDLKIFVTKLMFSYLGDLVCEPENMGRRYVLS